MCAHCERAAIEAKASVPDAPLRELAVQFGLSAKALEKHMAQHPRAAAASSDASPSPPPKRGQRRRAASPRNALVTLAPPPPAEKQDAATTTSATEEQAARDEGPATSRSSEIIASPRPTPAPTGDELADLMREIRLNLAAARNDPDATYAEKSSLIGKALSAVRLQKQLTGELGQTEAAVLASPRVRRLLADIIEALKPYPDASRAVLAKIEGTHGEVAA